MVALLGLVRDVGMRTALEDRNLLLVTRFDIRAGEVTRRVVLLARPYIINLSLHQCRRMKRVANLPHSQRNLFGCHAGTAGERISSLGSRDSHRLFRRTIIDDGIVFSSNNREMRTLRRRNTSVVGRRVGLDDIFVQKGSRRQHVGSVESGSLVVRCEKGYVRSRSYMQGASIDHLRVDRIAHFAGISHC